MPNDHGVLERLENTPAPTRISFETAELGEWDSGLITSLIAVLHAARANELEVDPTGLPEGARRLLGLALR